MAKTKHPCLIAFDMDGTLLDDAKRISPKTRRYLHHLDRQGHIVVLASGRPVRALMRYYRELRLHSPLACYNGACVMNPHDPHFPAQRYAFPQAVVKDIYGDLGDTVVDNVMCETNTDIWLIHEDQDLASFFWHDNMNIIYGDLRETLAEDPMTMIMKSARRNEADDQKIIAAVARHPGFSLRFWSDSQFSEIYHSEVSKGHALAHIAQYYGIPHERVIAFGDAENDIEMLEMAGVGVAMLNAVETLKPHADVISLETNNQDGIVRTLKKILKERA